MYISARALSKGGMVPYSGKFLRAQIFANQYARKKIRDFYFRDKVTISDHTPYNFPHGNGDPQCVFQPQTTVRR